MANLVRKTRKPSQSNVVKKKKIRRQQHSRHQRIQRAIENPGPETLTPSVIDAIQRTYGNHFALQLIQRAEGDDEEVPAQGGWQSAQPSGKTTTPTTPWQSAQPSGATTPTTPWQSAQPSGTTTPTTPWQSAQPGGGNTWQAATPSQAAQQQYAPQSAQSEQLHQSEILFGAKKAKGTPTAFQQGVDQVQGGNTTDPGANPAQDGQDIANHAGSFAAAVSSGSYEAAMQSLQALQGTLTQYMPFLTILRTLYKIIKGLPKAWKVWHNFIEGYKEIPKDTADPRRLEIRESMKYAAAKTRRFFFSKLYKLTFKLASNISAIISFITGGTTLVVTGVIDLLTLAAQSVGKSLSAAKAIYKQIAGKKGVNRQINAETLLNAAMDSQPDALQLLYDQKVGKVYYKNVTGEPFKDKETDEKIPLKKYQNFLRHLDPTGVDLLTAQLKEMMRSNAFKRKLATIEKKRNKREQAGQWVPPIP